MFYTFFPSFEYPFSGDVTQDIETSWFSRMKGIPEMEMHLITGTASYGTQLDKLIEAVLVLAGPAPAEGQEDEKIAALRSLADEIDAAKKDSAPMLRERIAVLQERLERIERKTITPAD